MKNIEEIIEMMKKNNPDIKMNYAFKRSLKNKLEVQSYAKLKNTKNKKINIAKSGLFSFKKDWKNIFEKPNFNFIKLLSPVFIWAFAVFWFMNFYWTDLFISEKWNNFNYEVEKIEEATNNKSPIIPFHKGDEQDNSDFKEIKKTENIIIEKKVIQKIVPALEMKKIIPETIIEETESQKKIIIQEKEDFSTNTELLEILWNEEIEENIIDDDILNSVESDFSNDIEDSIIINYDFEDFCNSKEWIIKDNICEYWEVKCNKLDFENNKCDKK